jgi:hypothetical protein
MSREVHESDLERDDRATKAAIEATVDLLAAKDKAHERWFAYSRTYDMVYDDAYDREYQIEVGKNE